MKRYFMEAVYNRFACEDQTIPVAHKSGTWVKYEDAQKEIDQLTQAHAALKANLASIHNDMDDLIGNSKGVAGLHLNGDIADWDWLKQEWLSSLDETPEQSLDETRAQAVEEFYKTFSTAMTHGDALSYNELTNEIFQGFIEDYIELTYHKGVDEDEF